MVWPAVIGAAASLAGGYMQSRSARRAGDISREQAAANMQLQREFAQHGIRWKVEDAKEAGIHPLYALGASTHSFSPVGVNVPVADGLGRGLASAGQNISRAMQAKSTQDERRELADLQARLLEAQIEHVGSQTALNLSRANPQLPPPLPNPMGGTSPMTPVDIEELAPIPGNAVVVEPNTVGAASRSQPGTLAGGHSGHVLVRMDNDVYVQQPNRAVFGEEMHSPGMFGWMAKQQFDPRPPEWSILRRNHPKAYGWRYNRAFRHWTPAYTRRRRYDPPRS